MPQNPRCPRNHRFQAAPPRERWNLRVFAQLKGSKRGESINGTSLIVANLSTSVGCHLALQLHLRLTVKASAASNCEAPAAKTGR